jgi:hypothetical protein
MARIIPSDLSRLALTGAHEPEIATLAVLRDTLPDDYAVFHGVHWTRQYKGRTLYGEIDFIVLNGAGRVLCIEQKNGRLEEAQGKLFKDYGDERLGRGAAGGPRLGREDLLENEPFLLPRLDGAGTRRAHPLQGTRRRLAELDEHPGRDQPGAAQATAAMDHQGLAA